MTPLAGVAVGLVFTVGVAGVGAALGWWLSLRTTYRPVRRIDLLQLRRGDTLVATIAAVLSAEDTARLHDGLRANMPDGVDVLLVSDNVALSVVRPAVAEPGPA